MPAGGREGLAAPVGAAFLAGIASASAVAWYSRRRRHQGGAVGGPGADRRRPSPPVADAEEHCDGKDYEDYADLDGDNAAAGPRPEGDESGDGDEERRPSLLRWMSMDEIKSSVDDIKSRIGELPSHLRRRGQGHWPWDRSSNDSSSMSSSSPPSATDAATDPADANADASDTARRRREEERRGETTAGEAAGEVRRQQPSSPPVPSSEPKSEYCIGGIFGLDVGGTLAKLVYFEQKPEECDAEQLHLSSRRDRFYRNRASAQAVLLARRGLLSTIDDEGGDDNDDSPTSSLRRGSHVRSQSTAAYEPLHRSSPHLPAAAAAGSHHHLRRSSSHKANGGLHHSPESNADLRTLNNMRQESVPDDLDAYASSTHMHHNVHGHGGGGGGGGGLFHTTESMDDMLDAMNRASKNNNIGSATNINHPGGTTTAGSGGASGGGMRKSKSMFDLNRGRVEAMDRFYSFAHRLDSYREGVKDHKLSFYSRSLGGDFHFIRFETRRMQNAMDLIRANNLHLNIRTMGATGGGAHKYAQQWVDELGIEMEKEDELDSLVAGMQFVLSTVVGECYTFRPNDDDDASEGRTGNMSRSSSLSDYTLGVPIDEDDYQTDTEDAATGATSSSRQSAEDRGKGDDWWWSRRVQRDAISYSKTYPYMLVIIGTGVSILRVDGPRKHERVSGSTIGGGTYWGLIRLLTNIKDNFEDAMHLAERGDASKVDMMVGDIYGENNTALEKIGLSPDVVASSFGKLVSKEDPASGVKQEDLARALLLMITINIGQVAYLNAKMHKTSRIYFVGNFLRFNKISQRRLSFSIDYWSKGEMEALYLEHEGYFGALGAFLLSQEIELNSNNSPDQRLRSQKSMPAPATTDDVLRHAASDHRLRTQKSMPAPTNTNVNGLHPTKPHGLNRPSST